MRQGPRQIKNAERALKAKLAKDAEPTSPSDQPLITDRGESESAMARRSGTVKRGGRGGVTGKREREPRTRAPPGAALALAQRESAAIVPPQGKKIVF